MSEHEHKYKLNVKGGYYYCYCGESDLTILDLMQERIKNHVHIKALEGVVEAIKEGGLVPEHFELWAELIEEEQKYTPHFPPFL